MFSKRVENDFYLRQYLFLRHMELAICVLRLDCTRKISDKPSMRGTLLTKHTHQRLVLGRGEPRTLLVGVLDEVACDPRHVRVQAIHELAERRGEAEHPWEDEPDDELHAPVEQARFEVREGREGAREGGRPPDERAKVVREAGDPDRIESVGRLGE